MKRILKIILLAIFLSVTGCSQERPLKFGIISDLHQDIANDAPERLQTFIDAADANDVDFIIQLGDFCFPEEENREFLNVWNSFPKRRYHVLGNHDMDICSKEAEMAFIGMPARYYSFDEGDFHFIVLDPNNYVEGGRSHPYEKGDYFGKDSINFIDPEQVEWLKKDLRSTKKRCFLFSHESIENTVLNREEVRKILEDENKEAGYMKIPLVFSGHDHTNYSKVINGITYLQINSASNQWVGEKYACESRFPEEVNKKRPALKYTVPYKDALYGIVTVTKNSVDMKGVKSTFYPPTPKDLNIPEDIYPFPLTSEISDFHLDLR